MAICPAGHTSAAEDYCDVCGLPVTADASPAPATPVAAPQAAVCPNCGARNAADALFCEACGYDFTTGTLPRSAEPGSPTPPSFGGSAVAASGWASGGGDVGAVAVGEPAAEDAAAPASDELEQGGVPEPVAAPAPEPDLDLPQPAAAAPVAPASPEELPEPELPAAVPQPNPEPGPAPQPPAPQPAAPTPPSRRPLQPKSTSVEWVAEVWIDPDWYAAQGSTEALPSPGLPEVVPLRASSALIGRTSVSRNIHPDIDCELDSGVSRRHAQVTTDGTRWWIEDLESSNGTFIGESAGQLPTDPIGRGRVEFAPDQRLYVGAWTRIVIRRATDDEKQAYNPS